MRVASIHGLIAICGFAPLLLASDPAQTQSEDQKTDWRYLLQAYASTFSLSFTIERDEFHDPPDKNRISPLKTREVTAPKNVTNPTELLDAIRIWLPEADVIMDKKTPGLVHIHEKSLAKRDKYLLDQKVSLDFKGTGLNLISELNRLSEGAIELSRGGVSVAPFRKETHVSLKDATYRDALDAGMLAAEAKTSGCILWETQAVSREGKTIVIVELATPLQYAVQPIPGITWPPATQTKPSQTKPDP